MIMQNKYLHALTLFLFFVSHASTFNPDTTLIMIDPAGDTNNPGRSLWHNYERKETYDFAVALKSYFEDFDNIKVILSRKPGDHRQPLQHASLSNKLNVDYFIRLHLHKGDHPKPILYAYNLVYNPITDFARRLHNPLAFIPLHQAHYKNIHATKKWSLILKKNLNSSAYHKTFDIQGPIGIPIKSLVGIIAPAILFEARIYQDTDWKLLVEPIGKSLISSLS